MTERELHVRVLFWQERLAPLGVGHWRFTVKLLDHIEDDEDEAPAARADSSPFYDDVSFLFERASVKKRIKEGTLDELIVHEWLHVADRDHYHVVRQLLDSLAPATRTEMAIREEATREGRIDRFARLIVALHN